MAFMGLVIFQNKPATCIFTLLNRQISDVLHLFGARQGNTKIKNPQAMTLVNVAVGSRNGTCRVADYFFFSLVQNI